MPTPSNYLLDAVALPRILGNNRPIQMGMVLMALLQQNLVLLLRLVEPLNIPLVDIWLNGRLQKVPELLLILL